MPRIRRFAGRRSIQHAIPREHWSLREPIPCKIPPGRHSRAKTPANPPRWRWFPEFPATSLLGGVAARQSPAKPPESRRRAKIPGEIPCCREIAATLREGFAEKAGTIAGMTEVAGNFAVSVGYHCRLAEAFGCWKPRVDSQEIQRVPELVHGLLAADLLQNPPDTVPPSTADCARPARKLSPPHPLRPNMTGTPGPMPFTQTPAATRGTIGKRAAFWSARSSIAPREPLAYILPPIDGV